MSFHSPYFVLAIIALSMGAWVITSWIRAKHGYPITDDWGNTIHPTAREGEEKVAALTSENDALKAKISRMEERLAVLERIATDPATRTAREIEDLR
jgi:cell division protein FtsB